MPDHEKWWVELAGEKMNKRTFSGFAALLFGVSASAATLQEWTFYSDPVGKTLSEAVNSAGAAVFSSGGSGDLETDGFGKLIATGEDSFGTGMWTNGPILNAALPSSISSGTVFLRYDFQYDLTDENSLNDSGTVLGFSFRDSTGDKVAGIALQYDVGAAPEPADLTVTALETGLETTGKVAVIARVDLDGNAMDVWYSLTGDTSAFIESSPNTNNIPINISTLDQLQFQATGDFQPTNSTDYAAAELLRMTDSFESAKEAEPIVPAAEYLNEWTFERDIAGRSLSETINTGTNTPLAQFEPGGSDVFTTNNINTGVGAALRCVGEDSGTDGVWNSGAVLDAPLSTATSGKHYLRYDVEYSLTNSANDSGTLLGAYFMDGTNTDSKAAGLVLGYDVGNLESSKPADRLLTPIPGATDIAKSGTLTAIAEVDLDQSPATLNVWYDLSGNNTFTEGSPAFSTNLTLTTIENLRFRATGDFQPSGTDDYAEVDNIRHAASWTEITESVVDLSMPPSLSISVTDSLLGAMEQGETNLFSVTVSNAENAGPATEVKSILTHDGASGAFTITTNDTPTSLLPGGILTNTFTVIANAKGEYTFSAQAVSSEINSTIKTTDVVVGSQLSYETNLVSEISGGNYSNLYEPGETLEVAVVSVNDGARPVSNVVNTLTSASTGFTITPVSDSYSFVAVGQNVTSTYTVVIGSSVANGTYTFTVTNSSSAGTWSENFSLEVFQREPGLDWVKADNNDDLDQTSSWTLPFVPNATDRAILNNSVISDITTDLGSDLSFKGIALISNTASWTVTGNNTLTLGSSGIDMAQAQAALSIESGLNLASSQTWNVATSQTLSVSGTLSGESDERITKTGEGTLALSGTNTFAGGLIANSGILSLGSDDALGTEASVFGDIQVESSVSSTLDNDIELSGSTVFNNADDLTLEGILSGNGSLSHTGSGTLILNGNNTYSGGTTNNGRITISDSSGLGSGPVTMNDSTTLETIALDGTLQNDFILNGSAVFETAKTSAELLKVDGNISGSGSLELNGFQYYLTGDNTFSGDLIFNHNNWLRFEDGALGNGTLRTTRQSWLLALENTVVTNPIVMDNTFRFHSSGNNVELAGPMSGSGLFQVIDGSTGSILLSGDNSGRTGDTLHRNGGLILGSGTALGNGGLYRLQPNSRFLLEVSNDLTGTNAVANNIDIEGGYINPNTSEVYPFLLNLDYDLELTGQFSSSFNFQDQFVEKNGSGTLILSGTADFDRPVKINEGGLTLNTDNFVSDQVVIGSGSSFTLLKNPSFSGDLTVQPAVQTTIAVLTDNSPLSGVGELSLAGDIVLDFKNYSGTKTPVAGDVFSIIDNNWSSVSDNGTAVLVAGLPPYLAIDDSNLFIDGTVEIVASRLSAQSLEITVPAGGSASESLTLSNNTANALDFTVANDGSWPTGDYAVSTQAQNLVQFHLFDDPDPETSFTNWNGTSTVDKNIGFDFSVFGNTFSSFSVNQNGSLTLKVPGGEPTATINPFKQSTLVETNTVRYLKEDDRLVIAWANHSDNYPEFQAWLHSTGEIEFVYRRNGQAWTEGTISLSSDSQTQAISHTPGLTDDSLLLTPSSWISSSPEEDTVSSGGSRKVTFTADATNQEAGETLFSAPVVWDDGITEYIVVTVTVTEQAPQLVLPLSITFYGQAGRIASTNITVSNSGDANLVYAISDDSLMGSGYSWTNVNDSYLWINVPDFDSNELHFSGDRSQPAPIGFPFTYYGRTYTNLQVDINGKIYLGDNQIISPFEIDLNPDMNTEILYRPEPEENRCTVLWHSISQIDGGADQTFEAILYRNGKIRFQYQQLGAGWSNAVIRLRDTDLTVTASLSNETTTTTTEEPVYEDIWNEWEEEFVRRQVGTTNIVTYNSTVSQQAIEFVPGERQVITASPASGTILPGNNALIRLTGDARSLSAEGSINVTNSTILTFTYSGMSDDLGVNFIATNSSDSAYSQLDEKEKSNMWGIDIVPKVVSQQNSDGSRTLSWPVPEDSLSRTYTVWFTTSLTEPFQKHPESPVQNAYSFRDMMNSEEPVIFYKVTVE